MSLPDLSPLTVLGVVAFLVLCVPAAGQQRDGALHRVFAAYYEAYLRENPEEATSVGRTEHDTRWRDWSRPARDAWREQLEGFLADLDTFSMSDLDAQDRISSTLLRKQIETELEGMPYDAYLLRVNQLFGLHTVVFLTMREMPARTEIDYENMLARLRAIPAYIEQNVSALQEAIEARILQPRLVVDQVIGQLEAQSSPDASESPLLRAFRDFPGGIPESQRQELAAEARRLYREAFQPAWNTLRRFLIEEYLPRARPSLAITSLADGDAIYRFFIRYHTTLPASPREIHEIGLREVERIDGEMDRIAREAGFEAGADAYERHLTTDPRYLFRDKESMLAYHRDLALRIAPGLTQLFHKLPRHPFGIRAIPPDREAASASNYNAPSVDGTRPGWFNLKAYMPQQQSRFDKPALVLHETNPGHHLQIATQLELEGLPEFRRIYRSTAYVEGWALYAETLGEELGVYDDAPSRFGALESERFRARRLVVDTGLHAMGWTRQQAIDFLGDASEVDRYIAWPGQALAYKMGQLKIMELKAEACRAHGAAFDVRDFHDAILRNGPLPLELLAEQVGEYIARAGPTATSGCRSDLLQ